MWDVLCFLLETTQTDARYNIAAWGTDMSSVKTNTRVEGRKQLELSEELFAYPLGDQPDTWRTIGLMCTYIETVLLIS